MEKQTAIKCGCLIDGTGISIKADAVIILEGAIIKKIGTAADIPTAADIVDVSGMTVMPGLIDAHMHYQGDARGMFRIIPHELRLLQVLGSAKKLLSMGYTTTRDCGSRNGIVLRDAAKYGFINSVPRIVASGFIVAPTNNGVDDPASPQYATDARTYPHTGEFLIADGVGEMLRAARMAIRSGADFIKIFNSGHFAYKHCPNTVTFFTYDELNAVVEVATKANKVVAAHCMCDAAVRQCLECGVKIIEHACGISAETAAMGAERGAVFTSVLMFNSMVMDPREFEKVGESYRILRKAGATVAAGTDLNGTREFPLGTNAGELEMLVRYSDFTTMDAIVSATKNAAAACGIDSFTGTLEVGKQGDIIIVDGDPLTDITCLRNPDAIKKVYLAGVLEVDRA